MKHWGHPLIPSYSHNNCRLHPIMRINILQVPRNHQPFIGHPFKWPSLNRMSLKQLLHRQHPSNLIFHIPLPSALHQ